MRQLQVGDKLKPHQQGDNPFYTEVLGVCGKVIFTRDVREDGSQSAPEGPHDPEDLETFGFTLME